MAVLIVIITLFNEIKTKIYMLFCCLEFTPKPPSDIGLLCCRLVLLSLGIDNDVVPVPVVDALSVGAEQGEDSAEELEDDKPVTRLKLASK